MPITATTSPQIGGAHLFLLTQYLSTANQRALQLLELGAEFLSVTLVCQRAPGNVNGPGIVPVRRYPNPTGFLTRLGAHRMRQRLDARLYFPSTTVLYAKAAGRVLRRAMHVRVGRREHAVLVTCVPPHDLLSASLELKQTHPSLRWIIDWQDLWSYDEFYFSRVSEPLRDRACQLERESFAHCDQNVVTNPLAARVLCEEYHVPQEKVTAIEHAFDRRNLPETAPRRPSDGMRIGFLGNLFKAPKVPGERVLKALASARAAGLDATLHVVGDKHLNSNGRRRVEDLDHVHVHPRTDHRHSLAPLAACDLLLVVLAETPNARIIMHAKLAPYLMLDRPILALVPSNSAVARIVRDTGAGFVIPAEGDWGNGLRTTLREWCTGKLRTHRKVEKIEEYSLPRIASRWRRILAGGIAR